MPDKRITIRATRYDPDRDEAPRIQSYDIPFYDESMVVLDALNYVSAELVRLARVKSKAQGDT